VEGALLMPPDGGEPGDRPVDLNNSREGESGPAVNELDENLTKSLILAQDERWRRA
jgi:hypothetical protein